MGTVFDVHAHIFPPLGSLQPGEDEAAMARRLRAHQYHQHTRGGPALKGPEWGVFRVRDNVQVHEALMLGDADGESRMPHVDFRIGAFGRTEFTCDGEDYRIQWLPATLTDSSVSPDLMVAQMDYAGVDRALIQRDHLYGSLDDYFAECMAAHPGRFAVLAQVDEWAGGTPEQLERVRRQVEELGFCGLYFATEAFFVTDFSMDLNDRSLEPLWDLVGELDVPVFWYISNQVRPVEESYPREIADLTEWVRNHPHIRCALTHALTDPVDIHPDLMRLLQSPNMHMELFMMAFTLTGGGLAVSPDASTTVLRLIDELGVEKLLWGSDMPCCERHLPYRRWVDAIRGADFLTTRQRDAILGGNLERLLARPSV